MQAYTFVLKYQAGTENKVADALSRCALLLNSVSIEVIWFDRLKGEYETCPNFGETFQTLIQGPSSIHSNYTLQDGYLFKDNRLYIPRTSFREFLVWETHAGGLAGHFGRNKTILTIEDQFFWPSLKRDIANIVSRCWTCAIAKQQK